MKKTIFLTLILTLFLAACGSNAEPAAETGTGTGFDQSAQELPLATKLAVGTLKLDNTDLAIAPDQAADLLPLWQVLFDLNSSDTASPEEITALTEQIQETMTSEQLQAIDSMGLTGQDIFATMQELGLANAPQGNAEGSSQTGRGFSDGQGFGGGDFPGGGPPDGGPPSGGFGGDNLNPEQIAMAQARRAQGGDAGFGNRMLTPLVEAVIELLESKSSS